MRVASCLVTLLVASPLIPAQMAEKVEVTVVAILAGKNDKNIDRELKEIAKEVQSLDPDLTSFRLARTSKVAVPVGESHKFSLVDEETALVTVDHGLNEDKRIGLTVKPPQAGDITYTTACGKYFPILTRYQTKDGDRLIVAIMVKSGS